MNQEEDSKEAEALMYASVESHTNKNQKYIFASHEHLKYHFIMEYLGILIKNAESTSWNLNNSKKVTFKSESNALVNYLSFTGGKQRKLVWSSVIELMCYYRKCSFYK